MSAAATAIPSGRRARATSAVGMVHANPYPPTTAQNYWQPRIGHAEFGRESFRVTAMRRDRPNLIIDGLVSQLEWQRQGAAPRTGALTFYRPLGVDEADLIAQNDQVAIDVSLTGPEGPWYRMLRLAVNQPQTAVVAAVTDLQLQTINISQLAASKASWNFSHDKGHPRGWTAQEITVAACRRFAAPIGRMPTSKTYLSPIVERSASAYDVIISAWKQERLLTGRRFIIDDDQGALQVVEVGTPRYMLPLGPALAEAVLNSFAATNYANAVEVHGKIDKTGRTTAGHPRKGKNAVLVTVVDEAGVKRYGYVQKILQAPSNLQTWQALHDYGQRYLAHNAQPTPTIEFTHPGVPWLDVGDAIMLTIPEIRFAAMVYVQSVAHSVGPGQYTMDVTIGYQDPWLEDQSSKVSLKNRRQKGLKQQSGSHFLSVSARPKSKTASVHAGRSH